MQIPSNAFSSSVDLQNLTLALNSIRVIRERAFYGLSNLRQLNLSGNSLTQLSANQFTMKYLEKLDLSHNDVNAIDSETFSELQYLKELDLSKNSLTQLDERTFTRLSHLKALYLNENSISNIQPNTFAGLLVLDRLELSSNSLSTINDSPFGTSPLPLRKLFLKSNNIIQVDANSFNSLPRVDFLVLADNKITTLPPNVFTPLKNLRKIHLQNNLLTEIPLQAFEDISKVIELQIKHNRLTFLPATSLSFDNLEKITLEGNPWQCPCLKEIMDFVTLKRIKYRQENNPYYNGEKPLCYVTPVDFCVREMDKIEAEGVVSKYEASIHERG